MPTCRRCGADRGTVDLRRHERERFVLVHCPDCGCVVGTDSSHAHDRPE